MSSEKSSVPLIMGIIGGVIGLPSALCAGACTAGLMSLSESAADAGEIGSFYLWMGVIGAVVGLYAGIIGKSKSKLSGLIYSWSINDWNYYDCRKYDCNDCFNPIFYWCWILF